MKKILPLVHIGLLCLALALAAGCTHKSRGSNAEKAKMEAAATRTTADPNSPNQHAQ